MGNFLCAGGRKKKRGTGTGTGGSHSQEVLSGEAFLNCLEEALLSCSRDGQCQTPAEEGRPASELKLKGFMHAESSGSQRRVFLFKELAVATGNFNMVNFLGEGGFGKVFKGKLPDTGEIVAVKRLEPHGDQGSKEFNTEISTLTLADHPNLVKLVGYCNQGDQRIVVYEFMPLGSLDKHLHGPLSRSDPLDWKSRMKIAAGAAKGLEYLHDKMKPPIIYRDLKCANILLGEGYHPKLSDFGLAKVKPEDDDDILFTRTLGTQGYCAPEYATTGELTARADLYSFGVVLLEIITGCEVFDESQMSPTQMSLVSRARRHVDPSDWTKFRPMVDSLLGDNYPMDQLEHYLRIAMRCVDSNPTLRPRAAEVALVLDCLANDLPPPPPPPSDASGTSSAPAAGSSTADDSTSLIVNVSGSSIDDSGSLNANDARNSSYNAAGSPSAKAAGSSSHDDDASLFVNASDSITDDARSSSYNAAGSSSGAGSPRAKAAGSSSHDDDVSLIVNASDSITNDAGGSSYNAAGSSIPDEDASLFVDASGSITNDAGCASPDSAGSSSPDDDASLIVNASEPITNDAGSPSAYDAGISSSNDAGNASPGVQVTNDARSSSDNAAGTGSLRADDAASLIVNVSGPTTDDNRSTSDNNTAGSPIGKADGILSTDDAASLSVNVSEWSADENAVILSFAEVETSQI